LRQLADDTCKIAVRELGKVHKTQIPKVFGVAGYSSDSGFYYTGKAARQGNTRASKKMLRVGQQRMGKDNMHLSLPEISLRASIALDYAPRGGQTK
jgi:hypothetical protein